MRLRHPLSAAVTVAVLTGLLTVPPSPLAAASPANASALADPEVDTSEDVPEVDPVPLDHLPLPVDPADAIVTLPSGEAELPPDDTASVVLENGWTDVPGLPVEVAEAEAPEVTYDETDLLPPAPPAEQPTTGDEVTVELVSPENQHQGVVLLQVDTTEAPVSEEPAEPEPSEVPTDIPTSEPTESASPSSDPTTDPTEEPAASEGTPSGPAADETPPKPSMDEPAVAVDPVVDVRLSYEDYASVFGGGWSDRVVVTAYPACFVDTPRDPACSTGVPVEAINDPASETLTFTTLGDDAPVSEPVDESPAQDPTDPLESDEPAGAEGPDDDSTEPSSDPTETSPTQEEPEGNLPRVAPWATRSAPLASALVGPAGGGTVYAVSGGAGSFAAEPISPSAQWQVGTGSGEFTYSYPFAMPPATVGSAPSLALSYSSSTVDGKTIAENGQASTAGMGWADLSPGYITRSYASCDKDGQAGKADQCWKTIDGKLINEYNLMFNGAAAPLVRIGATDTFRLRDDEGWRIELFKSTSPAGDEPSNADNNNEGFKVTTPDGTQYWFGWGHGSGSVWTVPVYGNDAGEPCYNATTSNAWCQQAWRWNLDRVVDVNGNKINYIYTPETNYYSRWADSAAANRTVYDRAGALTRIEYGFDRGLNEARQIINLTQSKRCTENMGPDLGDCTGSNSPSNAPNKWPDVPVDLICGDTGSCLNAAPSFFTLNMYTAVNTQTIEAGAFAGTGTVRNVDDYALRYAMPDPDGSDADTPDLWLNSIIRTGHVFGESLSLPKVMFDGVALQNRVAPGTGRKYVKFRLNSVRTETGGRIDVVYGHASVEQKCDPDYVSGRARWNNTRECWATRWAPPSGGEPQWEWFHKYVVKQIGLSDDAMGYRLGQPASQATKLASLRVFDYEYEGSGFWRFTNSKNTDSADETWADWRGYGSTRVHTRNIEAQTVASGDTSVKRTVRFRGMYNTPKNLSGDKWSQAETELSTAQMGAAEEPTDYQWLAGQTAEEATLAPNGDLISRDYTSWDWFETAHENNRDARIRYPKYTDHVVRVDDGTTAGSLQHHQVNFVVNDGNAETHLGLFAGVIIRTHDEGAPASTSDDRCAITKYEGNSTAWIRVPQIISSYEGSCAQVEQGGATLVGETKSVFDGSGTSPQSQGAITKGLITESSVRSTNNSWLNTRTSYDAYGRPVNQWDALGRRTDFAYNPGANSANILTTLETTNPLGHVTTTTFEPRTGRPVKVKDPNNAVTSMTYNGLGQIATVSLPGAPSGTPSISYEYTTSAAAPSVVHSAVLRAGTTSFNHTYSYFDGWGRQIESQVPQPETPTQRIVTATGYNNSGQAYLNMSAIANGNSAGSGLLNAAPGDVIRYTTADYDAAGRVVEVKSKSTNSVLSSATTQYLGDRTVSTPPVGGSKVTFYDRFGQTSSIELHAAGPNTALRDQASYTYTGAGQLATIKKKLDGYTDNYTWKYGYDLAGRQVYAKDPDTGATLSSYDDNSNRTYITTALDVVLENYPWDATPSGVKSKIKTTYDALNRPISRTNELVTPVVELAHYNYDTATKGKGRLASIERPIKIGSFSGNYITATDAYDSRGNVLGVTDRYPTWLTGEAANIGSSTVGKTTTYSYNEGDQVTSVTYPSSEGYVGSMTVNSAYTVNGALRLVSDENGKTLANLTYNSIGQPITIASTGDGSKSDLTRAYTWQNATGRLNSISGTITPSSSASYTALALTYSYDIAGNPLRVRGSQQFEGSTTTHQGAWCYTYDPLLRLATAQTGSVGAGDTCGPDTGTLGSGNGTDGTGSKAVTGPIYNLAYSYDTTGDRLKSVTPTTGGTPGTAANYTYTNGSAAKGPHAVAAISAATGAGVGTNPGIPSPAAAVYDDLGRIQSLSAAAGAPSGFGTTTYAYDAEGNLASTTGSNGSTRPNGSYLYGADGMRLARSTTTTSGATTTEIRTVYRSDGTELALTLTNGTVTSQARATRSVMVLDGVPIASKTSSGWSWLLGDQQHTVRVIRPAVATSPVQRSTYGPYGDPSVAPSAPGARGFLNQPHDLTGDVRLDHRNFTPTLGVLTTPDPVLDMTDPQSLNPYAYAGNNPISGSDPTGLMEDSQAVCDCGGALPAEEDLLPGPQPDIHDYPSGSQAQINWMNTSIAYDYWKRSEFGGWPDTSLSIKDTFNAVKDVTVGSAKIAWKLSGGEDIVNSCGGGISLSCVGNVAMTVSGPLGRAAKAVRVVDDIIDAERAIDNVEDTVNITERYVRPSGATTRAQRESVQGKPCVDCGDIAPVQRADHIDPLVEEYYRTGTIDRVKMHSLEAVQPQCPVCSNRQGAALSRYSIEMRKNLGLD